MRHLWLWQASSAVITGLVLLPLITLAVLASNADLVIWQHLVDTVLIDYVSNSLLLGAGVALLTTLLGVGSALLVTQYRFFASRVFEWALLLPLAMPAYITAYAYTGLFDVAGPVQTYLREYLQLNVGDYWFPQIRSLGGAVLVLSFVLYPYVYLLSRAAFLEQSSSLKDAAQLLGLSRRMVFLKVSLRVARPVIIAGVALALMETLADFGAVSYFGVSTFTTGIYRTWNGLYSVGNAALLSLVLLAFVFILLYLERRSRRQAGFLDRKSPAATPRKLTGIKQVAAFLLALLPLFLGFILPVSQLAVWAFEHQQTLADARFWQLVFNTFTVATVTAVIAVMLALIIAYSHRLSNNRLIQMGKQIVGLGYAVPGLVIALGVFIPLAWFDNAVDGLAENWFGISTGLLTSGTLVVLIFAYLVRFLAVSLNSVDSSLASIKPSMDQAAQSMGLRAGQTLRQIHIPLMRGSLLTAAIVVFVDVMKELPATLVLRPLNFNTLAVRAYELASDERLAEAALPALSIVLVGLVPVILLSRLIQRPNSV